MNIFNGYKFAEYIDMSYFKEVLKKELSLEFQSESLGEIYMEISVNHPDKKYALDKIFFDCIMYSHLKNVFVHDIAEVPKLEVFRTRVRKLIEKLNKKDSIPQALHSLMSEDGFYLMDKLNITSLTTKFIAGFDFKVEKGELKQARFLFTEVVPVGTRQEYFLAGIDLDFENKTCLIMMKNKLHISKLEDEQMSQHLDKTINSLYRRSMEMVTMELLVLEDIEVKSDRRAMYNLCKDLDSELLKDIRKEVSDKTNKSVGLSVDNFIKDLFTTTKKPSGNDKKLLDENITSLLIGLFVKTNFSGSKLVKKAKDMKLLGYPTKIKFTSNKANRGATQSPSRTQPVSSSEMFHSLYISFRDALALEQWSISWFTDTQFKDVKCTDVIQTTIYSKSTNFHIIFKPTRPLEKEIIYHVINNLNKYRKAKS